MTHKYSQRSLIVLSLLGILSAIMSVLSVILIFQLQSQQAAVKESPPSTSSLIPAHVWAVLLPVSTVLSALSLTLNLSSVVVCLLHSYFSTEVCRGEQDTDRYLGSMLPCSSATCYCGGHCSRLPPSYHCAVVNRSRKHRLVPLTGEAAHLDTPVAELHLITIFILTDARAKF